MISIETLKDALWWVQDGMDNADLSNTDYKRTQKCRDEIKEYIDSQEREDTE